MHRRLFVRLIALLPLLFASVAAADEAALALLKKAPYFTGVEESGLAALAAPLTARRYQAGETVVRAGAGGDSLFLLADGEFEVLDGKGEAVARLGRGELFGEFGLLTGEPRSAGVRAATDGLAYELTAEALRPLLRTHGEVIERMAHTMAERLARYPGLREGETVEARAAELALRARFRLATPRR